MKTIALTQGRVSVVDDEDYDALSGHKWSAIQNKATGTWFAVRGQWDPERKAVRQVFMHRVITGARVRWAKVIHMDDDGLNNRRSNLRVCTSAQVAAHSRQRPGPRSRYRGARWNVRIFRWYACIGIAGRTRWLGSFFTEEKAARAYDEAARIAFGDLARLNFPPSTAGGGLENPETAQVRGAEAPKLSTSLEQGPTCVQGPGVV